MDLIITVRLTSLQKRTLAQLAESNCPELLEREAAEILKEALDERGLAEGRPL